MKKIKITDPSNIKFEPFDNYGSVVPGMNWHKITYNTEVGQGTYILKMDPGAKSLPHEHTNYEVFKKGDFVTYEPGSTHYSYTKNGCLLLVFMRSKNKPIKN